MSTIENQPTDQVAPPPPGEYAIVEIMGHRTYVGRVTEEERFGTKLLSIEAIFNGQFLPPLLVGGASVYQFTPCTAETAFARAAKELWQLPTSLRCIVPATALPAPESHDNGLATDDEEGPF